MKHIETILCALALMLSLTASAQGIKPVKDKATKKYGYQTKGKEWVIEPQFDAAGKFDKHGYAEVKIKEGRIKYHGIIDAGGRFILQPVFRDVAVSRDGRLFFGEKDAPVAGFGYERLWGIYNAAGQEIFAPQFYIRPSFNDGYAIATDGVKRLKGVICENGSVPVPFEYLAITRSSGAYKCLATDFSHVFISGDFSSRQAFRQTGAVIPYDPQGDPVRAAAWRVGPIGIRFHENSLKLMEIRMGLLGADALCSDLPIEWGYGRFVRFEPFAVQPGATGSLPFSNQRSYTVKAILYEADGSLVKEVSSYGYFEAECAQGLIYAAANGQRWLALADINAPGMRAYTLPLTGYREIVRTDVFNGLGLDPRVVSDMSNHTDFVNRCMDIIDGENTGITSYIPLVQDGALAHAERDASRSMVFHRPFRMGEVVNCSVKKSDAGAEVKLHDELVCHFIDKFEDPYYKMEGDELIYWGPNNARTVGLSLIASSRGGTRDDVHGTGLAYDLVLSLYEEDGRWMRTLAIMPFADYVGNGMIVFAGPGIALLTRDPFDPRFEGLDKAGSGSGSGSEATSGSAAGSGRTQPAPQGHSQPTQHGRQPSATPPAGSNSRVEQGKAAQEKKAEEERRAAEEKKAAEQAVRDRERRIVRLPGEPIPHTLSALEAVR